MRNFAKYAKKVLADGDRLLTTTEPGNSRTIPEFRVVNGE
jgi:hypothetical protein